MGKLIVIDGTDGSGKETQMKILEDKLSKRGIKFKKVNFPNYNSPSSSLVKMYLSRILWNRCKNSKPIYSFYFLCS